VTKKPARRPVLTFGVLNVSDPPTVTERVFVEVTADARGVLGEIEESAGVQHLSGVDEVTDNLIISVGGLEVRATRLNTLLGVFRVNLPSKLVEIVNDRICQFGNFGGGHLNGHFVSFRCGLTKTVYTQMVGENKYLFS